ncbi:hypothetical protein [Microbacterium excoecariae]|nr:hypothetical protein [Microbacterium excoecariae]
MSSTPTFEQALDAAYAVYVRAWFDAHPEALFADPQPSVPAAA